MKKINVLIVVFAFAIVWCVKAYGADSYSGQAVEEAGQAGSHASKGSVNAIIGSGQVTSAASAVPLAVGGSAGAVSNEMAKDLMDAATAAPGTPLEITEETVTVGPPPDEALKSE